MGVLSFWPWVKDFNKIVLMKKISLYSSTDYRFNQDIKIFESLISVIFKNIHIVPHSLSSHTRLVGECIGMWRVGNTVLNYHIELWITRVTFQVYRLYYSLLRETFWLVFHYLLVNNLIQNSKFCIDDKTHYSVVKEVLFFIFVFLSTVYMRVWGNGYIWTFPQTGSK